jgi:hypothetical protein
MRTRAGRRSADPALSWNSRRGAGLPTPPEAVSAGRASPDPARNRQRWARVSDPARRADRRSPSIGAGSASANYCPAKLAEECGRPSVRRRGGVRDPRRAPAVGSASANSVPSQLDEECKRPSVGRHGGVRDPRRAPASVNSFAAELADECRRRSVGRRGGVGDPPSAECATLLHPENCRRSAPAPPSRREPDRPISTAARGSALLRIA